MAHRNVSKQCMKVENIRDMHEFLGEESDISRASDDCDMDENLAPAPRIL